MSGRGACRYVSSMSNHVVNPVVTPSAASGTPSGILAASLVGPDYKYSAVWTPINLQLGVPSTHHRSSCARSPMVCCHAKGTLNTCHAKCNGETRAYGRYPEHLLTTSYGISCCRAVHALGR